MKHIIEFTTDLFNSTEEKPHFINHRCFGEDGVAWIVERFGNDFVLDEPFQEDWGWGTIAKRDDEKFFIGLGIMDQSIGEVPARWLLSLEKIRKLLFLGKRTSPSLDMLADQAEQILKTESRITDIERYNEA